MTRYGPLRTRPACRRATANAGECGENVEQNSHRRETAGMGEVLKRDFMEPFGLSSNALAKALGVTTARVNEIVRGRRGITASTALRLAW